MDLAAEIKAIRDYTQQHPELLASHHFLYNFPYNYTTQCDFVVMGINPGESQKDRNLIQGPVEETSLKDFHEDNGSKRLELPWYKKLPKIIAPRNIIQTELFFWSSGNMAEFKARFGPLKKSPHLNFCYEKNIALFNAHKPRAIIFPGIGAIPIAIELYGLKLTKEWDNRDVIEYHDGTRPWIFTKHWTGFRLSNAKCAYINETISKIVKEKWGE